MSIKDSIKAERRSKGSERRSVLSPDLNIGGTLRMEANGQQLGENA